MIHKTNSWLKFGFKLNTFFHVCYKFLISSTKIKIRIPVNGVFSARWLITDLQDGFALSKFVLYCFYDLSWLASPFSEPQTCCIRFIICLGIVLKLIMPKYKCISSLIRSQIISKLEVDSRTFREDHFVHIND